MIMGEETPDAGSFEVGETVKIAYVDQSHKDIDREKSIWENFSDGQDLIMMGGKQVNSRAYLSRFNFAGSEQNKKVDTLSGGERNRLHLAMTLKEEGNVLLLDEPSLGIAPKLVNQIFVAIKNINKEKKVTIFLVEQNAKKALELADRGYVLVNGNVTLEGTGQELLKNKDIQAAYLEGGAKK